jgi:ferric-dicitrate binding protein FerR (iron transport regulator)
MNLPPNRRDELIELCGAVRDERVTEPEFGRLEKLLTEDAEAREFYVHFMTLHASLEQISATEMISARLREVLRDEEVVRELQSMIAAEGSAWASSPPRSAVGRYVVAIVASAALILVALFLGQRLLRGPSEADSSPQVAVVHGQVASSGVDGRTRLMPGTVVRPGQSVTTGRNASVRLRYPDGSTVDLQATTELALLKGPRAKRLQLATGTAYFDVSPQPATAPLVVNPGRYDQVEVVGTSFQMSRDLEGRTRVFVATGSIRFGAEDVAVPVKAMRSSVAVKQQQPSDPQPFDQATIWRGLSRGLTATYYNRENLTGKSVTRVDATIDFDWGKTSPDPAIAPDKFSARWTGRIEPLYTEPYTFYVIADEGARLWIDGKLVIDGWTNARGLKLASEPTKLIAGQTCHVRLEYHEIKDKAGIQLLWSSPSTPRSSVPHSQLHPGH